MPGLLTQLSALNKRLTINQKISIVALGALILCGILSFVYLLKKDDYQLLFSGMEANDASAVVSRLKQMSIPYELSDGGRSVSIPGTRINEARLDLATVGLPEKGRIGFEIFDKSNWSATDFTERVNYRRALEGELERTVLSLSEVSHARVHLVMEKDSLFQDRKQPAKASVVIRLKSGTTLSTNRVVGIVNLVAFAVEGLLPENVTVVDVNGNLLSTAHNGEEQALDEAQLSLRRKLEKEMTQKVVSILEPLVGTGKVRATASVSLDYSESQQTEEIFDPNGTVVLSSQKSEERAGDSVQAAGVPGVNANQGGAVSQQTVGDGRVRQSETVNYEVSKTVRQTRLPKGTVKQISMAVVVDDKSVISRDANGQAQESTTPREAAEIEQLRKLVSATIGFNPERGDSLTVENISFTGVNLEQHPLADPGFLQDYRNLLQPAIRYLAILLIFALFYLLVFRPVKKKVFSYVEFADPQFAQLAAATNDGDMVRQLESKMAQLKGTSPQLGPASVEQPASEADIIKRQLAELARREPETVTKLVKNWLAQES
jgi:flagellar M-ring protein FliF